MVLNELTMSKETAIASSPRETMTRDISRIRFTASIVDTSIVKHLLHATHVLVEHMLSKRSAIPASQSDSTRPRKICPCVLPLRGVSIKVPQDEDLMWKVSSHAIANLVQELLKRDQATVWRNMYAHHHHSTRSRHNPCPVRVGSPRRVCPVLTSTS